MASEVRLWRISDRRELTEVSQVRLDLEQRLEDWLADDISILDPQLLIIGRQVETDSGGFVDLLCLDGVGDVVVVELKRDKTPREVTAQVLDYGSWVVALSNERITSLAEAYLDQDSLEEAFERRFGVGLPETLGQSHRLLVVGSEIDASSERIINYLSGTHGVNINAATFQYFKDETGQEFLARVFIVEPSQVELRTRTKGSSKRRPNLTYDELQAIAAENGVADLYQAAVSGLEKHLHKGTTRSSIGFVSTFNGTRKVVVSLIPPESNQTDGLRYRAYLTRLRALLALSDDEVADLLPPNRSIYDPGDPDYVGFEGFFANEADVDRIVAAVARALKGGSETPSQSTAS